MKKDCIYPLLFCALIGTFSLFSMEEGEGKGEDEYEETSRVGSFERLPSELHKYITQFMGDTVIQTINNIISLSHVNKYFNDLISDNIRVISVMLKRKFGRNNIERAFKAALLTDNYKNIEHLLKFNLISIESILDAAMAELKVDLIYYLYAHSIIDNDTRIPFQYDLLTPVGFIINEMSFLNTNSGVYILEAMVDNGADINDYDGIRTTLYIALQQDNYNLFMDLLRLGADPSRPNADGTTVLYYIRNNPDKYFGYQYLVMDYFRQGIIRPKKQDFSQLSACKKSEGEAKFELFENLPYELHYYMTQFMGNTINETINNIVSLSLVNKYLNDLVKDHFEAISAMLKKKFYKNIYDTFYAAMETQNYKNIALLLKFHLIPIQEVLEAAVINSDDILIYYLYARGLIDNGTLVAVGDELLTPIGYIINALSYIPLEPIIQAMIDNGANINDYDGNKTTLYVTLVNDNQDVFDMLLRLGANPLQANKDGTSVLQYLQEHPDMSDYRDSIERFGFRIPRKYAIYRNKALMKTALVSEKPIRRGYFRKISREKPIQF